MYTLAYQWHANYAEHFGFAHREGCRVYGHYTEPSFVNCWSVPNLYLKKFEMESFTDTLTATLTANGDGQQSGFIIMGRDYARLAFELQGGRFVVKYITCRNADEGGSETVLTLGEVAARQFNAGAKDCYTLSVRCLLTCRKGGQCRMVYSVGDAPFVEVPHAFQARVGKWIGAKYGAYSLAPAGNGRGWIDLVTKR